MMAYPMRGALNPLSKADSKGKRRRGFNYNKMSLSRKKRGYSFTQKL